VPARFILIAAILIRMKSDIFAPKRERLMAIPESNEKNEELLRILANIPPLQPPIRRAPQGNVTVTELITALKKAFEVRERREEKKKQIRVAVERAVPHAEEDITDRINMILSQIESAIREIESDIEFSRLVKRWERKEIVKTLLPLLYLSQDGKVSINQDELFKEIKVKVKKHDKA
jgi:chromatin segregation and condensation protein Rec8/ScpA/Scc1 (kleisin family)